MSRLQQIVNGGASTSAAWEQCWAERVTPWDLGRTTPLVKHLVEQDQLPNGRCLVPGCGKGYDVLALASPSRYAIGLDLSQTAIQQAKQMASGNPNERWTEFTDSDFFDYSPEKPFDFIFDYTFFCALEPKLRVQWGRKMSELLSQDGELLTLMFPVEEDLGSGPPFAVSPQVYEDVLQPLGFHAHSLEDNKFSVEPRKGREIIGRWKRLLPKI